MFSVTFFRPSDCKLYCVTSPTEETATVIAGALMRKGYCARLWGRDGQLIF